jgi:hypothetical protein
MLLQAWRRIAHRAGVSTAGEPAVDRLRNAAPTNRDDILAVLPSGLVEADISCVSTCGHFLFPGAAAASREALKLRQYHAGGLPAALSFYPLSVESYSRLGAADSFALRCSTCHKNVAIKNPANFWSSHGKACTVSKEGTEFSHGMPRPLLSCTAFIIDASTTSRMCIILIWHFS